MSKIKVLSEKVINQIAAGEVVERPSAVVRELVDNATDAGATDIAVFIIDGGQTSIRVADNGVGMSQEDALLAFERHATSKLFDITDLETLTSMGFRGEALASIASVSRVRMKTRQHDSDSAIEIHIVGGKITSVQPASGGVGTEVEVRNLFFNTPARKKFLKSTKSEETKIKEWLLHISIAHPEIRYRLTIDEKEVLNLPEAQSQKDRAKMIFRGSTISFSQKYDEINFSGLIGHPSTAQGDTSSFVLHVNKRLVTDRAVLRAVKEGFSSTLKDREFPVGFLAIDIPPSMVDINVNPQKSEVRFTVPQKIFVATRGAIADAVQEFKSPISAEAPSFSTFGSRNLNDSPYGAQGVPQSLSFNAARYSSEQKSDFSNEVSLQSTSYEGEQFKYSALRYVGQIFKCYLLCEYAENLYVVDMHAAHERLNYNIVRAQLSSRSVVSQRLLVPLTVQLTERGVNHIHVQQDALTQFGFEFEQFGADTIIVRAVPAVLQHGDISSVIKEMAALDPGEDSQFAITERLDYVAARIACHGSIRSGRILKPEEAYALFEQMDTAEFSAACPHGRPCIISFSEMQVERWFGRDR